MIDNACSHQHRFHGVILLAALLMAAAPPPARTVSESDAVEVMRQFGTCVARRNRARARELLNQEPGSQRESEIGLKIATVQNGCLNLDGEMRLRPILLRGVVAEALYRADFGQKPPADAKPGEFVIQRFGVEDPTLDPARRSRNQLFYAFAGCVAAADPATARAFVLSEYEGNSEKRALAALSPGLGPCLPEGNKLVVNKVSLRALLAESLYRQATAGQSESVKEN